MYACALVCVQIHMYVCRKAVYDQVVLCVCVCVRVSSTLVWSGIRKSFSPDEERGIFNRCGLVELGVKSE